MTRLYQAGWSKINGVERNDWRIAGLLFIVISSVYYASVAGITSSNDGSHYALVRALVDKRSFEISEYLSFTENQDYALRGDLRYSDRPPGTALLAAPLDAVSVFLPRPLTPIHSKHDPDNARLAYTLLLPVLVSSLTAVILFWIVRGHFGLSRFASVFTVVAFAFGTMTWKYGSLLYSHATSGLTVMTAIALMLHWPQLKTSRSAFTLHLLLWFVLGASVLMEYTNVLFAALLGIYWLVTRLAKRSYRAYSWGLVGGLIPAAFLLWYNTVNFGGPLELSTFHVDISRWPQNTSFFHDFATPLWQGLPAMLLYAYDNQGLFWLAPVTLLGLLGLLPLWRQSRREFFLTAIVFVVMLLLFSTSTTFNPFTNDGRYLTPFLGLWFVGVGFGVDWIRSRIISVPTVYAILYGLLLLSIYNQILHIAFSWGHDLNPASLRPWAAAPENIFAIGQAVFPNLLNLPLWWGLLAIVNLSTWLWRKGTQLNEASANTSVVGTGNKA